MLKYTSSLLLIAILMLIPALATGQSNPLPSTSMATTDNVLAALSNPAWLGFRNSAEALFAFPYDETRTNEDLGVFIKLGSLGFVSEFINNDISTYNHYTLADGFYLGEGLYFGASYNWYRAVDWQGGWTLGVGYRPLPFLSAGAVAYDLNQPERDGVTLNPAYGIALAFRPFDHRLTLSGDLLFTKEGQYDYTENLDPKVRLEAIPLNGLRLFGEYAIDSQRYGIGLSIALNNLSVGAFERVDDANKFESGVSTVHMTSDNRGNIFGKGKDKIIEISLSGTIHEVMPDYLFVRPSGKTLHQLRQEINHYVDDPTVAGLLIKFENPKIGFAQAQQLRRTLLEFKASGKKLIAFSESYSQKDYFLATVCDEIYLMHVGSVDLRGLSAVAGYWKGTLDKLGIGVQVARVGSYKTAANSFIYTDTPESEAEMLNWLLDDLYNQIVSMISDGRGWDTDKVQEIIDQGPYYSQKALENGLVDDLLYYDEINNQLKKEKYDVIKAKVYWRNLQYDDKWPDIRIPKVAVIYAEGAITSGESSGGGFVTNKSMGSETITKAIRKAREDSNIDAIILRIDSPGGSAVASEAIYREIELTTRAGDNRKPVIVSMGNVAGSGGYYIACGADTIIAEEGTITGSIGVLGGKFNFEGLSQKIYHNTRAFNRGDHADVWRTHRPFNEEEMQSLQQAVNHVYDDFTDRVAEHRPLSKEEVDEVGAGRVWTGNQAIENQLVDLIGGMDLAFEITRSVLGVSEGSALNLQFLPKHRGFFSQLTTGTTNYINRNSLPDGIRNAVEPLALMVELYTGEPIMFMPYKIEAE